MTAPMRQPARAFGRTAGRPEGGFSLIEMIITLSILAMVIGALSTVLIQATLSRLDSTSRFESLQTARSAADMLARDLRSAGFGVDAGNAAGAQPAIAYIDSMQVLMCENATPYPDGAAPGAPEAYDPAGSPKPRVLVGTEWTPPCKYTTGAEIIRYTLDLNDDGLVDASDVASDEGADARRSRCEDDFTLVRQVYGDRSGGAAGHNGGSPERIALVLKPGGGVAPLFTVYMQGSSVPYDWSRGPVPVSQLAQISRIEITVTAASGRPGQRGGYSRTQITTAVRSMRNAPDFGATVFTVDGYVFEDADFDRTRDSGERGLTGALVRLGSGRAAYTNAAGYYSFRVPAGSYPLRHTAPIGFGSYSSPDSFVVDVAANESRSFADTSRTGGWITASVWDDTDGNGVWGGSETALSGVTIALAGGGQGVTDAHGQFEMFAPAGAWSLSVTPLSGYSVTTGNPATGSMTMGGTQTAQFGLYRSVATTVSGCVFTDTDGSGTMNGAESGRSNVTVTAYVGTSTVYSTTRTDASGRYSFSLPTPASGSGTTYSIGCASISGYAPTTTLQHTGLVLTGTALSGYNFGFQGFASATFQTFLASSMVAMDVWENDGGGTSPSSRGDTDLVFAGMLFGNGFIGYASNAWTAGGTPFSTTTGTTQLTGSTPFALFSDTLRRGSTWRAPDLAMGTDHTSNFEMWMRTGSGIPSSATRRYQTTDGGKGYSLAAIDCSGGTQLDLLVGTRSSSGRGTVEVWQSDDGTTPSYSRQEVYPTAGSVPGSRMGEATFLVLADMDLDGDRDLLVGTSTGTYSGEVVVMDNIGRTNGSRFRYRNIITLSTDCPKGLAATDVDGDGYPDIVIGTKTSSTVGRLLVYRNTHTTSTWTYAPSQSISAPGAVLCMAAADLGGSALQDVAVGYVTSPLTGAGGVRIYYNVGGAIATTPVDPSGGAVTKQVPALATGNFNYAVSPATAGPYRCDLAICWRYSSWWGHYVVYTR